MMNSESKNEPKLVDHPAKQKRSIFSRWYIQTVLNLMFLGLGWGLCYSYFRPVQELPLFEVHKRVLATLTIGPSKLPNLRARCGLPDTIFCDPHGGAIADQLFEFILKDMENRNLISQEPGWVFSLTKKGKSLISEIDIGKYLFIEGTNTTEPEKPSSQEAAHGTQ